MTLYIFRCKAQPRKYGATRYETGINLPTDSCSGGWEFFERVELSPRATLRYAGDTATIRRYVRQRGWHTWQEAGGSLKRDPANNIPSWTRDAERPRSEPESSGLEEFSEHLPKETPTTPVAPREPWRPSPEPESVVAKAEVREAEVREREPIPAARVSAQPTSPWPAKPAPAPEPPPSTSAGSAKVTRHVPEDDLPPVRQRVPEEPRVPERDFKLPDRRAVQRARHQVVWFDIPVRDIDRAVRFYSAVLGMSLKKEQAGPGAAIAALPHVEGAVGGSLVQNMDARPSENGPLLYLNTDGRLDEALLAVEKHGGKVLAEKHSIAPFGFRAVVVDSEGNRVALHSM
jgi:uncharacterized protein